MGYYEFPHTRNYDTDLGYLIDWFKTNKNKIEQNTAITIEKALSATEDAIKAYNSATNASNSAALALELKNQTEALKNLMQDKIDQIDANTSRIDNLATIDQGSITTTADAELVDIRVAYNGKTYSSAGDAVRGQVSELKSDIGDINKVKLFYYTNEPFKRHSAIVKYSWGAAVRTDENYDETYGVSDFIPISLIKGLTAHNLLSYTSATIYPVGFFETKEGGGTEYTPTKETAEISVDVTFDNDLITKFPNAKYVVLGMNTSTHFSISNTEEYLIKNDIANLGRATNKFLSDYKVKDTNTILLQNGNTMYNEGFSAYYGVTDYLRISDVIGKTFNNLFSFTRAGAYSIAFYDINKNVIGESYSPASTSEEVSVNVTIDETILSNYDNAIYLRVFVNTEKGFYISDEHYNKNNDYPSYKLNFFKNSIFCGDSVTAGFVTEGTESNPQTIYTVMSEYSYPNAFWCIYPKMDITTVAESGVSCIQYLERFYPTINYSEYDLITFELGLNGGLDFNDYNVEGTNTWSYRELVKRVRNQNANATIVLVRSSHFTTYWLPVLEAIANEFNCIIVDLTSTKYLNLDDVKYHGYYDNNGTPTIDYAHFTRKGYNAKAYVYARLLADEIE